MGKKETRSKNDNLFKDCGCLISDQDCSCDVSTKECGCDCGCHHEGDYERPRGRRGSRRRHEEIADQSYQAEEDSSIKQSSQESIYIIDSYDVSVSTTDTQVGASLQVALQLAISIVVNITIADSTRAQQITEDLLQKSEIKQSNGQLLCIEGSENVTVETTDTDVALSIQVLLQILVVILAQVGIL